MSYLPPMVLMEITPSIARQMLSVEGPQRALRAAAVRRMQEDMEEGRWADCYDPIILDESGHVINGQHRLNAVIAAGFTAYLYVVEGVPFNAIHDIDKGASRKVTDDLKIMGIPSYTLVAAMSLLVMSYDHIPDLVWNANNSPSKAALRDDCELNRDRYGRAGRASIAKRIHASPSPACAVMYLVERETGMGDYFFSQFLTPIVEGEGLYHGDPKMAVHKHFTRLKRIHEKNVPAQWQMFIWMRAWDAFVKQDSLKLIKLPTVKNLPMPRLPIVTMRGIETA